MPNHNGQSGEEYSRAHSGAASTAGIRPSASSVPTRVSMRVRSVPSRSNHATKPARSGNASA